MTHKSFAQYGLGGIPRRIHYCWFGDAAQSDRVQRCIESWHRVMPDFEVKRWDEVNAPMNASYVQRMYAQKRWAFMSDYVRLHALYEEGGLYFDTDVEVIRPFDPLLQVRCFAGFHREEEAETWVNNAVMGAVRGHWLPKAGMALMREGLFHERKLYRSTEVMTRLLRRRGLRYYGRQNLGDVRLYPASYFYPFPHWEEYDPRSVTPETYAIHHWEKSWHRHGSGPRTLGVAEAEHYARQGLIGEWVDRYLRGRAPHERGLARWLRRRRFYFSGPHAVPIGQVYRTFGAEPKMRHREAPARWQRRVNAIVARLAAPRQLPPLIVLHEPGVQPDAVYHIRDGCHRHGALQQIGASHAWVIIAFERQADRDQFEQI